MNIRKSKREKQVTRLKVARASPPISHLLIADDSLFSFCKANLHKCQTILQKLQRYERASGQHIKFSKSLVLFGNLVDESVQEELNQALGISAL